ncbi:hypothetical protein [Caldimonas brevitalea]|uniref:Uncharacterized protein n=1 Tax=Caldimonas brevitalea TaxID=413882 RepID=A0A0G3BQF4_9BURK|nr:hypothetical protein [Caldimonas brevitalea]AKJ30218.1 hypothetical protein AAW51_3527 [Caldimonas brevitalea]
MTLKKIVTLLTTAAFSWNASAGTDVLVHVANLSPYAVEVSFPAGNSDCWYDTVSDQRINEYLQYYSSSTVPSSYQAYLTQYQTAWGLPDLSAVPMHDMNNTSYTLAPAVPGSKVATVLFSGETKAALLEGCKDATSSRGFDVTLRDASGTVLSRRHYVLSDPPDSAWTLSRMSQTDAGVVEDHISLGSGGKTSATTVIKDVVNVAGVLATVFTLGAAGVEFFAARNAIVLSEGAGTMSPALATDMYNLVSTQYTSFTQRAAAWIFRSNMSYATALESGGVQVAYDATTAGWTPGWRLVYSIVSDGIIGVVDAKTDGTAGDDTAAAPSLDGLSTESFASAIAAAADFAHPQLAAMGQSDDDPSVCVYATDTVWNTECRAVGLMLAVQNDGSIVFMPMPSVGSGS